MGSMRVYNQTLAEELLATEEDDHTTLTLSTEQQHTQADAGTPRRRAELERYVAKKSNKHVLMLVLVLVIVLAVGGWW